MNTGLQPAAPLVVSPSPDRYSTRRNNQNGREKQRPRLSLVFPIYNESEVIPQLLERVDALVKVLISGATFAR